MRTSYFMVLLYAAVAAVMTILIDWGVSNAIGQARLIRLYRQSEGNLMDLEVELAELNRTIAITETNLAARRGIATPSADDLRQLAADHRLRFRQLERVQNTKSVTRYGVALQGRIAATVAFLKDLETDYRLEADYILLQPADEEGSLVELRMQLGTNEP